MTRDPCIETRDAGPEDPRAARPTRQERAVEAAGAPDPEAGRRSRLASWEACCAPPALPCLGPRCVRQRGEEVQRRPTRGVHARAREVERGDLVEITPPLSDDARVRARVDPVRMVRKASGTAGKAEVVAEVEGARRTSAPRNTARNRPLLLEVDALDRWVVRPVATGEASS